MKEPGNTPCIRLPEWEEQLGLKNVWVKDESANPTGTYKDRRSAAIMQHAMHHGIHKLVLISAGNAAYSLAKYAKGTGIEVHVVVDHNLTAGIKDVLRRICTQVVEIDLSRKLLQSEDLITMARASPHEKIIDVSNGYHEAYMAIVKELKNDLPWQPDSIAMPFGGGEALVGVAMGVMEAQWNYRTIVCGFKNNQSERLRSTVIFKPYRDFVAAEKEDLPTPVFDMTTEESPAEVQAHYVPRNIRAEEAGSYTFQGVYLFALADTKRPDEKSRFGENIVILNSGHGKVLEEAESENT